MMLERRLFLTSIFENNLLEGKIILGSCKSVNWIDALVIAHKITVIKVNHGSTGIVFIQYWLTSIN